MSEEYRYPHSVKSLAVLGGMPREDAGGTPAAREEEAAAKKEIAGRSLSEIERKLVEGKVIAAIRGVYDPEIPVNIYDLGLIYEIAVGEDGEVKVKMTLTAPGCPVAGSLPMEVQRKIEGVEEVRDAEVVLVWEPAWDKSRMSEEARLTLGF